MTLTKQFCQSYSITLALRAEVGSYHRNVPTIYQCVSKVFAVDQALLTYRVACIKGGHPEVRMPVGLTKSRLLEENAVLGRGIGQGEVLARDGHLQLRHLHLTPHIHTWYTRTLFVLSSWAAQPPSRLLRMTLRRAPVLVLENRERRE